MRIRRGPVKGFRTFAVCCDSMNQRWIVPLLLAVASMIHADETTLLSLPPSLPLAGNDGALVGGDFTGDGIRDFVVLTGDGDLAMQRGLGDGTFAPAVVTHTN